MQVLQHIADDSKVEVEGVYQFKRLLVIVCRHAMIKRFSIAITKLHTVTRLPQFVDQTITI